MIGVPVLNDVQVPTTKQRTHLHQEVSGHRKDGKTGLFYLFYLFTYLSHIFYFSCYHFYL